LQLRDQYTGCKRQPKALIAYQTSAIHKTGTFVKIKKMLELCRQKFQNEKVAGGICFCKRWNCSRPIKLLQA